MTISDFCLISVSRETTSYAVLFAIGLKLSVGVKSTLGIDLTVVGGEAIAAA